MLFPELMVTCMVSPTKANDFHLFNPPRPASASRHQIPSRERSSPCGGAVSSEASLVSTAAALGLTGGRVLFRDFYPGDGRRDRDVFGFLFETLWQSDFPLIALRVAVHGACTS